MYVSILVKNQHNNHQICVHTVQYTQWEEKNMKARSLSALESAIDKSCRIHELWTLHGS